MPVLKYLRDPMLTVPAILLVVYAVFCPQILRIDFVQVPVLMGANVLLLATIGFCGSTAVRRWWPHKKDKLFGKGAISSRKLARVPVWRLALAGGEDTIFVAPLLLLPSKLVLPALCLSAALFALAHVGYPPMTRFPKAFTIPLWYYFASRFGLLTVMVAHGLIDVLAVVVARQLLRLLDRSNAERRAACRASQERRVSHQRTPRQYRHILRNRRKYGHRAIRDLYPAAQRQRGA